MPIERPEKRVFLSGTLENSLAADRPTDITKQTRLQSKLLIANQ